MYIYTHSKTINLRKKTEKAAAKKTEAMPTPTAGKQEEPLTEVKKGKAGNDKAA